MSSGAAPYPTPLDVSAAVDKTLRREIAWAAAAPAAPDVGLLRSAAGILQVSDGSGGTTGRLRVGAGTEASPSIGLITAGPGLVGLYSRSANVLSFMSGATGYMELGSAGLTLRTDISFGLRFVAGVLGSAIDSGVSRVAAGIVGISDGGGANAEGRLRIFNGTAASPGLTFSSGLTTGWHYDGINSGVAFDVGGVIQSFQVAGQHRYKVATSIGWTAGIDPTAAADTTFTRAAAGVFGTAAIRLGNGTAAAPSLQGTASITTGLYFTAAGVGVTVGGVAMSFTDGGSFRIPATASFGWSATADPAAAGDCFLFRYAANIIIQRNGLTAQAFGVLNTFTDAANLETFNIDWITTPNVCKLYTLGAGTGVSRNLQLGTDGTGRWQVTAVTGHLLAVADNTYDIGATGATRPRTLYVGTSVNIEADRGIIYTGQTNAAGAAVGTLTNSPAAGNPTFWLKTSINGVNRAIPCWAG